MPVTIATGFTIVSVSMILLLYSFMFVPEHTELLAYHVVPADLLVDDEEEGIDGEDGAENYA